MRRRPTPDETLTALTKAITEDVRAERMENLQGPMNADGAALGRTVGGNLAQHRERLGYSTSNLAGKTGIAETLLEEIESGTAVPSMRAIWHIATALGVPFSALLQDEGADSDAASNFRIQRADSGRIIVSADSQFRSRVLFLETDPRAPEVYELTLLPGCLEEADAHATETFEHISVIAGTLVVRTESEEAVLGPGDCLFFRADQNHSYENPGSEATVAQLVVQFSQSMKRTES